MITRKAARWYISTGMNTLRKFSVLTAVINNEDTHSNIVRGHWCTGEDKTTCAPWSLHRRTFCEYRTSF